VRQAEYLPYPLQRAITRALTAAAAKAGRDDLQTWWAGQAAGLARGGDRATDVLRAIETYVTSR
jgi:NAD(P)H-dependent flavin oxidoreductase YrpB (nitropropane dioxygenase family)